MEAFGTCRYSLPLHERAESYGDQGLLKTFRDLQEIPQGGVRIGPGDTPSSVLDLG